MTVKVYRVPCPHLNLSDSSSDDDASSDDDSTQETQEEVSVSILNDLQKRNIRIELGDLVWFAHDSHRYRNTDVYIYDGVKMIDLQSYPDDYGTLPKMFRVVEPTLGLDGTKRCFSVSHWHSAQENTDGTLEKDRAPWDRPIQHNYYVWMDVSQIRDQLRQNAVVGDLEAIDPKDLEDSGADQVIKSLFTTFVSPWDGLDYYVTFGSYHIPSVSDGSAESLLSGIIGKLCDQGAEQPTLFLSECARLNDPSLEERTLCYCG